MHKVWHVVVEIREGDPVFRSDWLANDNLVDVIKLVPVLIPDITVLDQRFEFRSSRNGHVQCLCCEEALRVEQVEEVLIHQVSQQLIGQPIQGGHLWKGQVPFSVCGSVYMTGMELK